MTGDQYVDEILAKYAVNPLTAKGAAENVAPKLRQWAGVYLSDLAYSGSFAKGTGNSLSTDVDLFISLNASTPDTLGQVYSSLLKLARDQGWSPVRQNVSIGINCGGVKLDLVPGKIQSGYQNYHSLYKSKSASWTQTNVKLHVDTVLKSGRAREIRAVKLWRSLHRLEFPSFLLELAVIEALKSRSRTEPAGNVLAALGYIGANLPTLRIVDPANTNNLVSDDMTVAEKNAVAANARTSAQKQYWKDIIW